MNCTFCGEKIWFWQKKSLDGDGFIHDYPEGELSCRLSKIDDEKSAKFIEECCKLEGPAERAVKEIKSSKKRKK
jgi:hypothetical protein